VLLARCTATDARFLQPKWTPGVSILTAVSSTPGPLTPEHRHELMLAGERAKPIRKAARVATFNAWSTGIVAALSAPFALMSVTGLLVTVGLSAVAYNEFRGRKRLLAFDPSAATLLGWNQVGLLAMITVYCLWMMYTGLAGGSSLAAEMKGLPDLEAALGSTDELNNLYQLVVFGLYGTVIALSAIFQGLNALYYFTRRGRIEDYARETPPWVLDVQRSTSPA
jgi:hypothetical protein